MDGMGEHDEAVHDMAVQDVGVHEVGVHDMGVHDATLVCMTWGAWRGRA
jgi:hypothetical protein